MRSERGPLLEALDEIEARSLDRDVALGEIFEVLSTRGESVLLLFFALPFLQPVPFPGLSTPFGLMIVIAACLQYSGRPPWIPKSWKKKKLPRESVRRVAQFFERVFLRIRRILHPRAGWMFFGPWRLFNCVVLVISALLLALPLPIPFSNNLPALAIFSMALAQLEEDGLFVWFSYVLFTLTLSFFFVLALGVETGIGLL